MENISENKPKPGRPLRELSPGLTRKEYVNSLSEYGIIPPEIKSERGKINFYYAMQAFGALKGTSQDFPNNGEFSFIVIGNGREDVIFKRTIFQELGRLGDENLMKEVARKICVNKMSTQKAIIYIRQFRSEKKKGDKLQLVNEIINKLNDYDMKHSNVDYSLMFEALDVVRNIIMEKISENN
jgi:hypothetical protein